MRGQRGGGGGRRNGIQSAVKGLNGCGNEADGRKMPLKKELAGRKVEWEEGEEEEEVIKIRQDRN